MLQPELLQAQIGESIPGSQDVSVPDAALLGERGFMAAMRRRRGATATVASLALTAELFLSACGSSAGSNTSGGGSTDTQPRAEVSAATPTGANYTSGQIWDGTTGCLEDYLAANGEIVNATDTELCRQVDTSITTGTFYLYYKNGTDPSTDWQKIAGQQSDGFTYWMYSGDKLWYRRATDGGPVQVKVNRSGGGTVYEDLYRFVVTDPTSITAQDFEAEDADEDNTNNESVAVVGTNPQPVEVGQSERDQVADSENAEDTAMDQLEQNYNVAVSNANSSRLAAGQQTVNNELQFLGTEDGKEDRINTQKDCTDDDRVMDGC
jgi:hypothetical protein